MFVVHIVPIDRGIFGETLSYFSAENPPLHALVKIPVRGKTVLGLVATVEDAREAKSTIRSGAFLLKRMSVLKGSRKIFPQIFLPEFLEAASVTAQYFAATTGGILASLIPAKILEEYAKEKSAFAALPAPASFDENPAQRQAQTQEKAQAKNINIKERNKFILQLDDADRYASYRSLVREQFAKGKSAFLCAPRVGDAERLFEETSRGIEQYAFLFHSQVPWKTMREQWRRAAEEKHPVLLVATPSFLSLPRQDIGLFAAEKEHSPSYRTPARPIFDTRFFMESLAEKTGAHFVLGGSLLRTETLFRYEEKELIAREPIRSRFQTRAVREIIDAREGEAKRIDPKTREQSFRIITEKLEQHIRETLPHGKVFLYGTRRGLAPQTLCRDCGTIVSCDRCSASLVLHRNGTEGAGGNNSNSIFLCHKCGARRSASEKCRHCGGWRMESLGVGIEAAAGEIRKLFPEATIFELHRDAIQTEKEARAVGEAFAQSGAKPNNAILLGTEKALPFVREVSLSAVLSLDPLFLLPDFRIGEKILRTLFEIESKTADVFAVQTRRPEEEIFAAAKAGDSTRMYRSEIAARKAFAYPPFSVLIKISWSGTEERAREKSAYIRTAFEKFSPRIFPAFAQKVKHRWHIHAAIKIPKSAYPDPELSRLLAALTPDFRVEVEPEDLL